MFKQPMNRLMWIPVASAIVLLTGMMTLRVSRQDRPSPQEPTIEQIQSLSSLVTARGQVADVILVDQHGFTGGVQVAAVIKGDYLIETNLAEACFEQIEPAQRRAVLLLRPPRATTVRVDLQRSRLFGLSSYGAWRLVPGDADYTAVANKAYQQAQAAIAEASANPAALAQARRQAETVLATFLRALDWEVTVRWQDDPATRSSTTLNEGKVIMNKPENNRELDADLAALRGRLAQSIGYLAARRWLSERSLSINELNERGDNAGDGAQGISRHKPKVVDPP